MGTARVCGAGNLTNYNEQLLRQGIGLIVSINELTSRQSGEPRGPLAPE